MCSPKMYVCNERTSVFCQDAAGVSCEGQLLWTGSTVLDICMCLLNLLLILTTCLCQAQCATNCTAICVHEDVV